MHVSLTEPATTSGRASTGRIDLRLIVSVVRITDELERLGDLALRVVSWPRTWSAPTTKEIFDAALADVARSYRLALRSFASRSAELAEEVATVSRSRH